MGNKKKTGAKQQDKSKAQSNGEKVSNSSKSETKSAQNVSTKPGKANQEALSKKKNESPVRSSPSDLETTPARLPWRLILVGSLLVGGLAVVCTSEPTKSVIENIYQVHLQPHVARFTKSLSNGKSTPNTQKDSEPKPSSTDKLKSPGPEATTPPPTPTTTPPNSLDSKPELHSEKSAEKTSENIDVSKSDKKSSEKSKLQQEPTERKPVKERESEKSTQKTTDDAKVQAEKIPEKSAEKIDAQKAEPESKSKTSTSQKAADSKVDKSKQETSEQVKVDALKSEKVEKEMNIKDEPETAKPAPESVKPTPETVKPAPAMTKPAPETAKSTPETAKPAPETTKSAPETAKSAPETAKSAPETAKSAPETAKPTPETAKPTPDTAKPAPETAKPAPETAKPAPETAKPASETAKSAPETAKPTPEISKNSPEYAKNSPETSKNSQETVKNTPVAAENVPEMAKKIPEATKTKPDTANNAPELVQDSQKRAENSPDPAKPDTSKPTPDKATKPVVEGIKVKTSKTDTDAADKKKDSKSKVDVTPEVPKSDEKLLKHEEKLETQSQKSALKTDETHQKDTVEKSRKTQDTSANKLDKSTEESSTKPAQKPAERKEPSKIEKPDPKSKQESKTEAKPSQNSRTEKDVDPKSTQETKTEEKPSEKSKTENDVKSEATNDQPTPAQKSDLKTAERATKKADSKIDDTKSIPASQKASDAGKDIPKDVYVKANITSKADLKIREKLDEADDLMDKKKYEDALRKFDSILRKHPTSPRAQFGRGNALDEIASQKRSNEVLEQSIKTYEQLLYQEGDIPPVLLMKVGLKLSDKQQFRGWGAKAAKTLQFLVDKFPSDLALKRKLGVSHMMVAQNDQARVVFQKIIDADPNDGFSQVHLGFIIKLKDNDPEKAIPLLKSGIESGLPGTQDGKFLFHLGDAYQRLGRNEEARKVYQRGADNGIFLSADQRSLYNVNTLKGRPWWTREQTGYQKYFQILEDNWQTIRDEGLSQLDSETGLFRPEGENLREKGDWKQLTLYQQGRQMKKACEKVPKTCALIEQIPDAKGCKRGQVKFSVMRPGLHVWPHCGPTNCRIRAHLGLVVPKGPKIRVVNETRTWKEGKMIIFDDSFEHEVWHDGDSLRMVLIVDFWHPDLTEAQKRTLVPI